MKKVFLTEKDKLIPRVGRSVTIGEQKIAVFLLSDGRVVAVEDICPLTNGPILEGTVSGEYIYEPMRDYKISLIDGKIQEPDKGEIEVYPVVEAEGKLFIEVAK